jgi:hypothetical protein
MKKSLLMLIALGFVVFASAQVNKSGIPEKLLQVSAPHLNASTGNEVLLPIVIQEQNPYFSNKGREDIFGLEIGRTWYDLQTNSGLPNRLVQENSGNISAVWTIAVDGLANYPTRGSGFNYSTNNGSTWLPNPTIRVEDVRVGWGNIGITNTNHLIVAHSANNGYVSTKPKTGTTWTYSQLSTTDGYIWPRMVSNGNTVHVIGTTNTATPLNGFSHGSLTYWRSTDGGVNWVDQGRILPNYDTAHFGKFPRFQDDYNMAIKGDTVAILVSNTHAGTFMWKSTNAGVGWTFIDILNPPCRKWDPEGGKIIDFNNDAQQDNIIGSDGSSCVVLDNNGMAHCFFGRMQESGDGSGGPSYYPYWDGIYYWNESMPAITWDYFWNTAVPPTYCAIPDTVAFPCIAYLYDLNGNGQIDFAPNPPSGDFPFGIYQTSLTSQINAAVDKNNNIHIAFSAVVENVYTNVNGVDRCYRNIFMLHHKAGDPNFIYPDGKSTWKPNPNYPDSGRVMSDNYTEEVYPNMIKKPFNPNGDSAYVAFWYQADALPGNSLQPATPNHGIVENVINFKKINVRVVGINEKTANITGAPKIYPNPATNNVSVVYNLSKASNVTLGIYNMVGQQLMTTSKYINAGEVNVALNIEKLPQGIYFIKSNIGNETYTNKLVVE